ncbi:MAG: hypothetical protein IPM57_02970 [Oligoflexia bacterium]|nr:hypothetical protein [Oligoflexia bacterium]
MKLKNVLILSLIFLSFGCGKKKQEVPSTQQQPRILGINNSDTDLVLDLNINGLKPVDSKKYKEKIKTSELLELIEHFTKYPSPDLKEKAYALYMQTIKPELSSTFVTGSITPPGSPYAEQVYQFLQPYLISQFSHSLQKALTKVEAAADKLPKPDGANLSAKTYLEFIIIQLGEFNKHLNLLSDSETKPFIDPVVHKVSAEYMIPLEKFISSINWQRSQTLTKYLTHLSGEIKNIPGLSDEEKRISQFQLQEAMAYAKQNDDIKDSARAFNLIIDMWINKSQRENAPTLLINGLKKYNDQQLIAIATNNQPLFSKQEWQALKERKDLDKMTDKELLARVSLNSGILKNDDWQTLFLGFDKKFINGVELNDILISRQVSPSKATENEKLIALVSFWLNLKTRVIFPSELVEKLSEYTDKELEKLKDQSWWNWSLFRRGVIDFIESYPGVDGKKPNTTEEAVENFKIFISEKVFSSVESTLRNKIYGLAAKLKSMVREEVSLQLQAQREHFPKLAFDNFKEYGNRYLKLWFFQSSDKLSLFESEFIELENMGSGFWKPVSSSQNETSSELIARSLSLNYLQLLENNLANNKMAFQLVNKLSSIAGYKDYNGKLVDALMFPVVGDKNKRFNLMEFDRYDPLKLAFALPDIVYLKDQFRADYGMLDKFQVSVNGQMNLLESYTKLIEWLKPWRQSSFDKTLGTLKISIADNISKEVFPKKDLFKQPLVLSLSILANLKAHMLGLVDVVGNIYLNQDVKNPQGAVLFDFDNQMQRNKIVKTADIATAMEAISNFYLVLSDLNVSNFQDDQINAATIGKIQQVREELKSLLVGLILFSTKNLLQSDFGYSVGYNFQTKQQVLQKRNLKDQLKMQRSLILAGNVLNSDLVKSKAIENYYYINKNFWNPQLGFYSRIEDKLDVNLKISDLFYAFETLQMVEETLIYFSVGSQIAQQSLAQLRLLKQYWSTRLISGFNKAQNVVELLGYQRPVVSP